MMQSLIVFAIVCLCASQGVFGLIGRPKPSSVRSSETDPVYYYRTEYINQVLDHFSFADTTSFWTQRVLINDTYWQPGNPIFLYAGNEGPIDLFANNSGFMWDIMQEFGAALIFPEHRYYGESMPINNSVAQSFASAASQQYLTAEQALADYAEYIQAWKKARNATSSPVVVFGGSYGGMLAAWFRLKYPHIVAGAIAASAPIFQFEGMVDPKTFNNIVSNDIRGANPYCAEGVFQSWNIMRDLANQVQPYGRKFIADTFHICPGNITTPGDVTNTLFSWLVNAWTSMAMGDYPYSASFLGGMPPNPINVACSFFTEETLKSNATILEAHFKAVSIYYNYTNQFPTCIPLSSGDISTLADAGGWNYQSCTEMVMPIGQYGLPNDVFDPQPWDLNAIIAGCQQTYGITPRPNWVQTYFTGLDLSTASNIVFTNGNLDPWSGGGVLSNWSDTVVSYIIEGGAHHLDLRGANPNDPASVKWVRRMQIKNIRDWVYGKSDHTLPTKWAVAIAIILTAAAILIGQKLYQVYQDNDPAKPSNKPLIAAPASAPVHDERKDSLSVSVEQIPQVHIPSTGSAINSGYVPLNSQP